MRNIELGEKLRNRRKELEALIDLSYDDVIEDIVDSDRYDNSDNYSYDGTTDDFIKAFKMWKIDGNYWSKDTYTYEQAKILSETLVNCDNCLDCSDCVDCRDLKKCSNCSGCKGCFNCYKCIDCVNCNDCKNSELCDDCNYCYHCIYCKYCELCDDCNNCYKCVDCKYCDKCQYISFETSIENARKRKEAKI